MRGSNPLKTPARVRVLIADGDLGARVLLRRWLDLHGSLEVAAETADGVQAVDEALRVRPELAVLGLGMPRMDALEVAAEIRRLLPDTRIVIRSAFSAERMAQKAIDAGADVYIEKVVESSQLLDVLEGLFPTGDLGSGGALAGVSTRSARPQSPLDGLLLDAFDAGVLLIDDGGRVRSANLAATLVLGVPTSHLVGSSLTDLLARARPEDGEEGGDGVPDPVTEALTSGRPQSGGVLRVPRPGGGSAWLSINVRPIRDAEGSGATGAVAVISDVTEERRLREALRHAEARTPRLLDAVSTPLAVLRWRRDEPSESADFVVAHVNPAAQVLTGWVVGSRVDREAVRALDGQLQRIGDDEVVVSWQLAGSGSSPGTSPAMGGTLPSDTTELLEAAMISSPVGAVLLDGSARLVIANPVADRLLGGSSLLGSGAPSRVLRWADTLEPVGIEDLPVQAACGGAPFDDVELFVTEEDGSAGGTYVKISGRTVLGPQGRPVGAVISVLDDTATKEAEHALAATHLELRRSNTELANFASTASHDLSQPLQKIYGFAEMLQQHSLDDARAHDYIDRIVVGCERMSTLIRDLLTYSRLTSDARPFERVDLTHVVQEVVELFEQEIADNDARIEVGPLPTVLADRTQMSQLFQNLIGNALTYATSGEPPVIHVRSAHGDSEWQITVEDNGIGISPENRQRAFAMFERLATSEEHAGTGIGLAVCAKVAERHGGRIWIDGNPTGGTSISFTLPDRAQR